MEQSAPQSAGIYDFLAWFEKNKKRVAIGAGVAVAAALIGGVVAWQISEKKNEAALAFASVPGPSSPFEIAPASTAEAYVKVANEYPGTQAGAKALLRAGTTYFALNNFAKAREQFDAYLRQYGATPWVSEAVFGVAATLEAEGKTNEAIEKYKDFVSRYSSVPSADMARFNLARLYEQSGQPALALETLNKMIPPPGAGPSQPAPAVQEAQARIRALLAKNPSLVPTPTPTPQPTPAAPNQPLVLKPQAPAANGTSSAPKITITPQPAPTQPAPNAGK
jgi:tetratricopeptide (TPR) repeat protein